jgi:hypothetical protein
MMGQQLVARETEILRLLGQLRERPEKFTLIGGYAVDAYSPLPRYSVDCDMVVAKEGSSSVLSWLHGEGYKEEKDGYRNELEGVETKKLDKKIGDASVSVDLMVGGLRCRQTEAVWTEQEVRRTAKELRVVGINGSVLSNVASKELLITLKLHSGRDTDLRDVVMLADRVEWYEVERLCSKGVKDKVVSQLEKDIRVMSDEEFEQHLKASFGAKAGGERRINGALSEVRSLLGTIRTVRFPSR